MERSDRSGARFPTDRVGLAEPADAALADADDIVARAAADEAAADDARARFRHEGLRALQPDERIAPLLELGERLVAIRRAALLDRREPSPGTRLVPGVAGDLYVTSRRLVLIGRLTLSFELDAIEDAVLSGERLLLVLHEGHGVALQVAGPRPLWVEIAAARASARSSRDAGPSAGPLPAARYRPAASARFRAPSLRRMLLRCISTVRGESEGLSDLVIAVRAEGRSTPGAAAGRPRPSSGKPSSWAAAPQCRFVADDQRGHATCRVPPLPESC